MLRTGILAAVCALALAATPYLGGKDAVFETVPVRISGKMLTVAVDEATVAQWQECVDDGVCAAVAKPRADADVRPMTGVNWFDVQAFVGWANSTQGRQFRLPTVDEWRFIRGEPEKPVRKPLFDDPRMAWAASYGQVETPGGPVRPQGAWSTSKDGIHDLDGNVWEWTASCSNPGQDQSRCAAMQVMGAHDAVLSVFVRDPASGGCATGKPPTHVGFRLVEDLP